MSRAPKIAEIVPFEVPRQPLDDFFTQEEWAAWVDVVKKAVDANYIALQQARKTMRFRTPVWELTRRIKAHPRVGALSGPDARVLVHRALGEIYSQDKEVFLWENHLPCKDTNGDYYNPEDDFLNSWEKCSQVGPDPLATAVDRAKQNPPSVDHFGPEWAAEHHERLRLFLAVAEELQASQGDDVILLPVKRLGKLLKVSPMQISIWRKTAESAGFLLPVHDAVRGKRATEFYFRLSGDNSSSD